MTIRMLLFITMSLSIVKILSSHQILTECEEWTYGVDCQLNCSCDTNTTEFCDKERGSCECLPGFVGQNCSDCKFNINNDKQ